MPRRLHELTSPLGDDAIFRRMKGREVLGRPFEFTVEIYCPNKDLRPYDALGKPMSVGVRMRDEKYRYFHGIVSRFVNVGPQGGYQLYEVQLRPWLWFLTRTSDCRIFQNKTVPEILEDVFKNKNGFSDFRRSLNATYRKWEYCVQYRETDFDFANRLMEQEGIYYYFEHEKSKHTLVLADSAASHKPIDGTSRLPYRAPNESFTGEDHIFHWLKHVEVQTGAVVLRDYDFEKPSADLEVKLTANRSHGHSKMEKYDHPGEYKDSNEGKHYVKMRLEELQAQHIRLEGKAHCDGMATGGLFTLTEHPRKRDEGEYLVISSDIEVESGEIEQFSADSENRFDVHFYAITKSQPFRPPQITPKPIISGPQTAKVVGKSGEEIWTDKYGRVKVQFPWDREGKNDENSSCWVRVAQVWAGKSWGAIHIPRIGQEVVVEFLEGDPDRPLITGRVYNAEQMVPYALPDNQTQSGIKSRSTKTGDQKTFNELRFEDKKDEEQIYFHAEKDFERIVENNDTLKVGFDKKDKGDQTIEIFNNQSLTVGNDQSADGSQTIEIWKDRTETVKMGNEKVTIETGNRDVIVSKGNDTHTINKGNRDVQIDMGDDTLKVGKGNQKIDVPIGSITISAGQSITLKVGASSIKITPDKIAISAPQIAVQGQIKTEVAGAITQVNGSGMVQVKGGVVMIN